MTTTTPISDVTTPKLPSTMDDEKLDSSLAKKKSKIDEKQEKDADCESSDASSGEWEITGYEKTWVKKKSEPQWDVDSFDGREYKSDPDDQEGCIGDEDYQNHRILKRKFFESKGFTYEPFSGNYPIPDEDFENMAVRQRKEELANVCIKKYNEEKNKTVELVKIVRVIVTGGSERKNYITFMAGEYPNGPLVEYQAKVIQYFGDAPPFPIICRPSPISTIEGGLNI